MWGEWFEVMVGVIELGGMGELGSEGDGEKEELVLVI